jgi:S1-C subfamily serine protease/predicted esterase
MRQIQKAALALVTVVLAASGVRAQAPAGDDLNGLTEKAIKDAVKQVAPSVVQIQTQGGTDMIVTGPKGPAFRKAMGPTTGLIVSADGYIISSAFNFINNPTTIVVGIAGHKEPYLAKRVATDRSRLLTLLKIEASGLPVAQASPKKDFQIGQWAIALGRTLDTNRDNPPSVSIGILSALGRIWGKAVQTDAKISPANYGGPLVDIEGRVQGVLIPASPQGEVETAGVEWYDSGIGFAVPLEDVLAMLPRLKEGKDLHKGLLGVRLQSPDLYSVAPVIGEVTPGSAAAKAGLKTGDTIIEIDGHPIVRMAQVLHQLGPKYEGDTISLKYRRGKEEISIPRLELVGALSAYIHAYLGILPLRDDPKLGVEIRHVFPKSPADKAGLKAGERIVKYGKGAALVPFKGQKRSRLELLEWLNGQRPGDEIKVEVEKKAGKAETVTLTLADFPGTGKEADVVPAKLPSPASKEKALEPLEPGPGQPKPPKMVVPPKVETGLVKRTTADGRTFWVYSDEDYEPNISHALVVWLHPPRKNKKEDFEGLTELWSDFCAKNNIIMVCPQTDSDAGWNPGDTEFVQAAIRDVLGNYTVDRRRVVAHGMGVGGQMALHLGFHARDLVRGVATSGAVVTQLKDNLANQRLAFYLVAGGRDPLVKAIADSKGRLTTRGFPIVYREYADMGRQYLDERQLAELVRWIDELDRL